MHREMLLMRPDVQKELKISGEQLLKLRPLFAPPMGRGGMGGPGGPPPMQGPEGMPQQGNRDLEHPGPPPVPVQDGMDMRIQEVLSEGQYKRLKELRLQRQGAMAVLRKDVADQVGLSDEERQQIRGMVEEMHESMPREDQMHPVGPDEMRQKMQDFHKQLNDKVLARLTAKERAKLEELCGKPFAFDEKWRPEPPKPPYQPQGGGL
jgi:hypothetical protein